MSNPITFLPVAGRALCCGVEARFSLVCQRMAPMMKRESVFLVAVWLCIAVVLALFGKMILPFITSAAWAVVLAVTWHPLHRALAKRIRPPGLAAAMSTAAVALVIIAPSTYVGVLIIDEAKAAYEHFQGGASSTTIDELATRFDPVIQAWSSKLSGFIDTSGWDFRAMVTGIAAKVNEWAAKHAATTLANVGKVILQFFLMLVTIYYIFKDGVLFKQRLIESIPLSNARSEELMHHITEVLKSAIFGSLVVAAIQGGLGALLFLVLGLPSPILWGAVMMFFALIPLLGAFVVYIPAALVLLMDGSYIKAVILLAAGIGIVSQIDNFLRPMLMAGRTKIHPLLLFFSILGGVSAFGFVGLVAGPVIAALVVVILDVYRREVGETIGSKPAGALAKEKQSS